MYSKESAFKETFEANNARKLASQLLKEKEPSDLLKLENLISSNVIKEKDVIDLLIYDWSQHKSDTNTLGLNKPRIPLYLQYEGLRDGDQIGAPGIERLSNQPEVAKNIFMNLPSFGVKVADLGMPIMGNSEVDKILSMVKFIDKQNLPIIPAVAGRTHPDDITAITELSRYTLNHFNKKILVYSFVGSSRIRMLTQGKDKWNLESINSWISDSVNSLKKEPSVAGVIVPFEDTFGSYPEDLQKLFRTALDSGADGICICDTCSRGISPDASRNLIKYIGHTIAPDYPNAIWEIHTHNMLGRAVTNAMTAYKEGLIGGVHVTLGGVGDLGGNTPLESFVREAKENEILPNIDAKELDKLDKIVETALSARNISIKNNPFGNIYSDVSRYVATGIHASAFKRLEEVGPHLRKIFEMVYFPISPSSLGLNIRLDVVSPVSGKTNVEALAKRLGVSDLLTNDKINAVLSSARFVQRPITDSEFLDAIR